MVSKINWRLLPLRLGPNQNHAVLCGRSADSWGGSPQNDHSVLIFKLEIKAMQNQSSEFNLIDAFERIPVKIFPDLKQGSLYAAGEIARLIREKQSKNERCVLGLATGSTPKTLYSELVRMHQL